MLDVAIQLFAERGIAATTVAQIAAAGVTSAMVHYYFTNREQLLDAIVEERLAQVIAFVWRPTEPQIENDPFALVAELVDRFFDVTHRSVAAVDLAARDRPRRRVAARADGPAHSARTCRALRRTHPRRAAGRYAEPRARTGVPVPFDHRAGDAAARDRKAVAKRARGLPPIERDVLHRHVRALLGSACSRRLSRRVHAPLAAAEAVMNAPARGRSRWPPPSPPSRCSPVANAGRTTARPTRAASKANSCTCRRRNRAR